jgi:hypothetical protein
LGGMNKVIPNNVYWCRCAIGIAIPICLLGVLSRQPLPEISNPDRCPRMRQVGFRLDDELKTSTRHPCFVCISPRTSLHVLVNHLSALHTTHESSEQKGHGRGHAPKNLRTKCSDDQCLLGINTEERGSQKGCKAHPQGSKHRQVPTSYMPKKPTYKKLLHNT